ncbi:MAG: putative amidase AmiD [Pseudomonadota bacterium]
MATVSVTELTAIDLRESLVSGETQIEPFVDQHWEFVADLDAQVNAFCSFDKEVVTAQASDLLAQRSRPQPLGSLYGVPIGIKDIIDTVDYPTAYGSAIHQGRYPVVDATIVRRLKHAGALIFGKTVTTEFATFVPGPTRNPHNLEHTPGGSSSGSAALWPLEAKPTARLFGQRPTVGSMGLSRHSALFLARVCFLSHHRLTR